MSKFGRNGEAGKNGRAGGLGYIVLSFAHCSLIVRSLFALPVLFLYHLYKVIRENFSNF